MKILLVDNGTTYLSAIHKLLSGNIVETVSYQNIPNNNQYDLTILSGGHQFSVVGNEAKLSRELGLVKSSLKPVLGICFGFELIGYAFGAHLSHLNNKEKGVFTLQQLSDDPIFTNLVDLKVYDSHRWIIDDAGDQLIPLAASPNGIEIVKHQHKPIYGFQFHPEMFPDNTSGDELFKNYLQIIGKIKS